MNVLHENLDIWEIVSLVKNNVEKFNTIRFFEYEGEIEKSKLISTFKFEKRDMDHDLLFRILLAIHDYIGKFDVKIDVHDGTVIINLKLLK